MHSFTEILNLCVSSTLGTLNQFNKKTIKALETSGATNLVKTLQMIELQKAIFAVGIVSIFESNLQEALGCKNGFNKAKEILMDENELTLLGRFDDLILAINALKHGKGRSYDTLRLKYQDLPFKLDNPNESEGNVAEIYSLIDADDAFVLHCQEVICDVSTVINRVYNVLL